MFARLLVASLALSAFIAPVQAESQSSLQPSIDLLKDFEAAGGRVYINSAKCDKSLAYGWYVSGTIHICIDNHVGDQEELHDTIRHEVWHAVQACNGGPLMYDLDAEVGEAVRRGWLPVNYPRHLWETEAEARNAAHNYTEAEISEFLSAYCH